MLDMMFKDGLYELMLECDKQYVEIKQDLQLVTDPEINKQLTNIKNKLWELGEAIREYEGI